MPQDNEYPSIRLNPDLSNALRRNYEECLEKIRGVNIIYNVGNNSQFNHITNNLLVTPRTIVQVMDYNDQSGRQTEIELSPMFALRRNLALLHKYLDICWKHRDILEREVTLESASIPLGDKSGHDAPSYIQSIEKILTRKAQPSSVIYVDYSSDLKFGRSQ